VWIRVAEENGLSIKAGPFGGLLFAKTGTDDGNGAVSGLTTYSFHFEKADVQGSQAKV